MAGIWTGLEVSTLYLSREEKKNNDNMSCRIRQNIFFWGGVFGLSDVR